MVNITRPRRASIEMTRWRGAAKGGASGAIGPEDDKVTVADKLFLRDIYIYHPTPPVKFAHVLRGKEWASPALFLGVFAAGAASNECLRPCRRQLDRQMGQPLARWGGDAGNDAKWRSRHRRLSALQRPDRSQSRRAATHRRVG